MQRKGVCDGANGRKLASRFAGGSGFGEVVGISDETRHGRDVQQICLSDRDTANIAIGA